jgi:serine protease inhibitor
MIHNMFSHPLAPGTKAVVSNCLYFNGTWEYEFPFEPGYDEGRNATFRTFRAGKTVRRGRGKGAPGPQMTYMAGKLDFPYYRNETLGLEILSLPYEHGERSEEISEAHMFLVKPTTGGEAAYTQLERSFSRLHFQEIFQRMQPVYGLVELPRMKMEFQANLRDVLGDMGAGQGWESLCHAQAYKGCSRATAAETSPR